jgi:C1A family cysteine protease
MTTTPTGHGLGLLPDPHDDRDHYRARPPMIVPYQFTDLEHDPATPPIWDQGQLGSCTAHGSLAAFLYASAKDGADDPMLSRLQVYYAARALEGTTDQDAGAAIRDAIKAVAAGVAPESLWPYDITRFAEEPPAEAITASASNRALEYARVGSTAEDIQQALSAGLPVVIGVTLYASFESSDAISSGIVPMPDTAHEDVLGGHCMAVWGIGHGLDWRTADQFPTADPNTLYVKVRNSWGTGVYQGGYLLMPIGYLSRYGSDFWTIEKVS